MKLQSKFSREFLKTIFASLPPLASAARCGPHPRTSLATPVGTPTSILSLILLLSNVVGLLSAKRRRRLDGFKPSLPARRYASAVLGMALCLSQSEFCQKGAQVGYSATYSPVVGQTKLTTLATVDSQFITQTVRYSTLRVRPHVAWVCLLLYTCCPFTITTGP